MQENEKMEKSIWNEYYTEFETTLTAVTMKSLKISSTFLHKIKGLCLQATSLYIAIYSICFIPLTGFCHPSTREIQFAIANFHFQRGLSRMGDAKIDFNCRQASAEAIASCFEKLFSSFSVAFLLFSSLTLPTCRT